MTLPPARVVLAALTCGLGARALPALAGDPGRGEAPSERAAPQRAPDRWATLRGFLGTWEGTNRGEPGNGTVRREYRLVLGDRFIEVRNRSTYPPREKGQQGEVHEDVGYFSVDRARGLLVLRQFHVEGFVNTYTSSASSATPGPIVFTTEAIENIAPGWRARETYRFEGSDELVEVFELAEPGKEFKTYTESRLKRTR